MTFDLGIWPLTAWLYGGFHNISINQVLFQSYFNFSKEVKFSRLKFCPEFISKSEVQNMLPFFFPPFLVYGWCIKKMTKNLKIGWNLIDKESILKKVCMVSFHKSNRLWRMVVCTISQLFRAVAPFVFPKHFF